MHKNFQYFMTGVFFFASLCHSQEASAADLSVKYLAPTGAPKVSCHAHMKLLDEDSPARDTNFMNNLTSIRPGETIPMIFDTRDWERISRYIKIVHHTTPFSYPLSFDVKLECWGQGRKNSATLEFKAEVVKVGGEDPSEPSDENQPPEDDNVSASYSYEGESIDDVLGLVWKGDGEDKYLELIPRRKI